MIIVMRGDASEAQVQAVVDKAAELGFEAHPSRGMERAVVGIIGVETADAVPYFELLDGVERVVPILKPYKFVAREAKPEGSKVRVGDAVFGGEPVVVIAGPCAVEDQEMLLDTARWVKECGGRLLRGGAFKPRTSPHTFQGLGEKGLEMLAVAREETGLPVVTEVMDTRDVPLVSRYADVLQVGTRNMQNFPLLQEVGRAELPVLLKRGTGANIEEFLQAAEYVVKEGNDRVILCERGIRTFETATRNTLDISAIPAVHEMSHLPIIADPSHATGYSSLVPDVALGSIAAGADGLIVEVHPKPEQAAVDGPQSLTFEGFEELMLKLRKVAEAVGRSL